MTTEQEHAIRCRFPVAVRVEGDVVATLIPGDTIELRDRPGVAWRVWETVEDGRRVLNFERVPLVITTIS